MNELAGLFASAFLAATLIPAQSELVLAAMDAAGTHPAALLVAVATAGNVAGAVVNWLLGRFLMRFQDRRWFPVSSTMIERATGWYRRWGVWSLLGAWLPVVGDPLTLVAGILRAPLPLFLLLVTIGKGARYAAIVWIA
ncbi:MAG: YqaA family protein [Alphaproteobacteria bacterium]